MVTTERRPSTCGPDSPQRQAGSLRARFVSNIFYRWQLGAPPEEHDYTVHYLERSLVKSARWSGNLYVDLYSHVLNIFNGFYG